MTVSSVLAELRAKDIHVWAEGGQLRVNARAGALTPDLQEQLRENKDQILEYLTGPTELSFSQQRLWFLDKIEMVNTTYLVPLAVRIEGNLRVSALRQALDKLVARHESLRTTFPDVEGLPVQRVEDPGPAAVTIENIEDDNPGLLDELMNQEMHRGFDLVHGPLFRAVIYRLSDDAHVLLLLQHHIIQDAWSLNLMMRELGSFYSAIVDDRTAALPELTLSYRDYTRWIREQMQGATLEHQLDYWRSHLEGAPHALDLATDRPRPAMESHAGAIHSFSIPRAISDGLPNLTQQTGTTLFMALAAALDVMLWRYTGQEDLLVGVPIANRDRKDVEGLIGLFVNTLVIRSDLSGNPTVSELLTRVRKRSVDAFSHQELPVEVLVEHIQPTRDLSRNPMFQVMLVLETKSHQPTLELPGLSVTPVHVDRGGTHIDWTLYVEESEDGLCGHIEYATDFFDESTIARMARHLQTILQEMIANPEHRIADISLVTPDERNLLLEDWNATEHEFARDACLHDVLENQAAQSADKLAVTSGGLSLNYSELQQRANQFARTLRDRGIQRGQHVGICVERGVDMLAIVIGTLKAGAAYIPLDPSFPRERLQFMAEDAELALLVSTNSLAQHFDLPRERLLLLDEDASLIEAQSHEPLTPDAALDAQPEDAAYLIYTSGSTGKPKGVVVPHRAVVNFLSSMAREPGLTTDDILVAVTTLSFDIAVLELYLPLMVGATVVIASHEEAVDGTALIGLLETHGATVMQATPVTWRLLLEADWSGGAAFKALVGGEALPLDLADQLIATDVELWNMYGPTETTVWSTCCHVTNTSNGITIGTPIDNTKIYILDEQKNLCPIGVPGELYIGGDGVTLGYWKRPDLTADRFIPDTFADTPNATMYGTGDKARWLNDGTLQHLGRFDDQIKVRGYRVELGEIEARIAEHPEVRQAAVHLWNVGDDDVRIVACCIPQVPGRMSNVSLRKHLRSCLPEYMIPQYFMIVEDISLTPNGKIDRRRLPIPAVAESSIGNYEPPEGEGEKAISEIWTELIRPARPIGRSDKFFDMGGHSLLALRAIRKMEQKVEAQLDFRILFHETLAEIAAKYVRSNSA